MKKILKYIFITILILFISWILFGSIMTYGHKSMLEVDVPIELKKLEKKFKEESNGGDAYFRPIQKHEIDECHFNIDFFITINDDSISKSKIKLDNYINSVNKRINEQLKNKICMDSLIISVSASKVTFSKSGQFRYSFPIQ